MMRYRTIFDVILDRLNVFKMFGLNTLFSNTYNTSYLVNQCVSPSGKMHSIFLAWCEEHFPSCYKNVVYDEDFLLNTGPQLTALAELMLLDLNIIELDSPYPMKQPMSSTSKVNNHLTCINSPSSTSEMNAPGQIHTQPLTPNLKHPFWREETSSTNTTTPLMISEPGLPRSFS